MLQIPCEKVFRHPNPLQNHWQNGLEHKGYHRMRVISPFCFFGLREVMRDEQIHRFHWLNGLICSTIKRLLWIVLVDFSLQERERECFVLFFVYFFATQLFSFPNCLCLFCVIFEASSYLTPCIYAEPGANFIVPSVGHPKSVVFRIRESPPQKNAPKRSVRFSKLPG